MKRLTAIAAVFVLLLGVLMAGCRDSSPAKTPAPDGADGEAAAVGGRDVLAEIARLQKEPNGQLAEISQEALTLEERMERASHEIYSREEYISLCGLLLPYVESRENVEKALPDKTYDTVRIGATLNSTSTAYFASIEESIRLACLEYGFDATILICDFDANKQNSHIDQFIMEKVDCVIMDPCDPLAAVSMVERCVEAGIPVVTQGEALGDMNARNITTCTISQYEGGFEVGRYVAEKFEGREIIAGVLLGGFGSTSAEAHTNGQLGGIVYVRSKQYGTEISKEDAILKAQIMWEDIRTTGKGSIPELDLTVAVSNGNGQWTEEGGMKCGEEMMLATEGKMNLCIADNDVMAYGAMRAIEQMGYTVGPDGVQFSACGDSYGPALAAIKEGKILVTAYGSPYPIARSTVDLVYKIFIEGYDANNMCPLTVLPVVVITQENVDKFYDPAYEYAIGINMEFYTIDDNNSGKGLKYYK